MSFILIVIEGQICLKRLKRLLCLDQSYSKALNLLSSMQKHKSQKIKPLLLREGLTLKIELPLIKRPEENLWKRQDSLRLKT